MVTNRAIQPYQNDSFALFETNLFKFPLAILSDRHRKQKLHETVDSERSYIDYRWIDDQGIERFWTVEPSANSKKGGYWTQFTVDVLGAVFYQMTQDEFTSNPVWRLGSLPKIQELLELKSNNAPSKIKRELFRISSAKIHTNAFWIKSKNAYYEDKETPGEAYFSIWNVYVKGQRLPDGTTAETYYLEPALPVIYSLMSFYLKPFDFQFWRSQQLKYRRLYEITGPKFYGKKNSKYIVFDYVDLCKQMPTPAHQHISKAKEFFEPIHAHMMQPDHAWFNDVRWVNDDVKRYDADRPWQIRYYPGARAVAEIAETRKRIKAYLETKGGGLLGEGKTKRDEDVKSLQTKLANVLGQAKKNGGLYHELAKLVVTQKLAKSDVRYALLITKQAIDDNKIGSIQGRSPYFYGVLKKHLASQGKSLDALLKDRKPQKRKQDKTKQFKQTDQTGAFVDPFENIQSVASMLARQEQQPTLDLRPREKTPPKRSLTEEEQQAAQHLAITYNLPIAGIEQSIRNNGIAKATEFCKKLAEEQ